jgi:hypothetical protein
MLPGICLPFLFWGIVGQYPLNHGDTSCYPIIVVIAHSRRGGNVDCYESNRKAAAF